MLTTVEGVYRDGKVELNEVPKAGYGQRVLVTFLESDGTMAPPHLKAR